MKSQLPVQLLYWSRCILGMLRCPDKLSGTASGDCGALLGEVWGGRGQ